LSIFGSTAGSLLVACGAGLVTATENVRRRRTLRISQAATIVNCRVGNYPIQPTTGAADMQKWRSNVGRTSAYQTRDHQGGLPSSPEWSFASALRSSVELKKPSENQKGYSGPPKKQVTNNALGRSMMEEILNSNATDNLFVALTMVQHIMIGLLGAALEEEKFQLSRRLYLVY
jgi:hypothetical protein